MSYFVSPRLETSLRMGPGQLADDQESWAGAVVRSPGSSASNHALEWVVRTADLPVEGSLDRTCQVVHLEDDLLDCARFAIWYRGQVPEDYTLVFYGEGYSAKVDLRAGIEGRPTGGAILGPVIVD